MRTSTWLSSIGLALAIGTVSSIALAGWAYSETVTIVTGACNGESPCYAQGSLNAVRYSSDSQEQIGCVNYGSAIQCSATNAAGTWVYCFSSDPTLVANERAINETSSIWFLYDASGTCTNLDVDNTSFYLR